jgi:hypothetical protein
VGASAPSGELQRPTLSAIEAGAALALTPLRRSRPRDGNATAAAPPPIGTGPTVPAGPSLAEALPRPAYALPRRAQMLLGKSREFVRTLHLDDRRIAETILELLRHGTADGRGELGDVHDTCLAVR